MKDYFETESESKSWCFGLSETAIQLSRWEWMKDNILNPIRQHLGVPVYITSCLRNEQSYHSLVNRGYHPSKKSDHFAGTPIKLTKQSERKKFGGFYTFSTFACDLGGDFDHKKLCRDLYLTINNLVSEDSPHFIKGLSKEGVEQLILETQNKDGKLLEWLHISAPLEAFYSESESKVVRKIKQKHRWLVAVDGKYSITKFG